MFLICDITMIAKFTETAQMAWSVGRPSVRKSIWFSCCPPVWCPDPVSHSLSPCSLAFVIAHFFNVGHYTESLPDFFRSHLFDISWLVWSLKEVPVRIPNAPCAVDLRPHHCLLDPLCCWWHPLVSPARPGLVTSDSSPTLSLDELPSVDNSVRLCRPFAINGLGEQ